MIYPIVVAYGGIGNEKIGKLIKNVIRIALK